MNALPVSNSKDSLTRFVDAFSFENGKSNYVFLGIIRFLSTAKQASLETGTSWFLEFLTMGILFLFTEKPQHRKKS